MTRRFIIFFLTLLFGVAITSKGNTITDSPKVNKSGQRISSRSFDQTVIENFKSDADFIYEQPPETRPNFIKMLFVKLFSWLASVLGSEGGAWIVIIVIVIVGVVGIGFALYGIFGIGKTIPIYSKEVDDLAYEVKDENIHEVNFAIEIDKAVEQKDFRRAIRLMYLYTLKLLSNNEIIHWLPSKTNHDYQYEIQDKAYQQQFATLSYYFEYVWYGDFKAEIHQYEEMKNVFKGLESKLRGDVEK